MVVDTDGVTKMVDKDSLTKIVGGVCGEEEAGGGRREAEREAEHPGYRIKNNNPTQSCGQKIESVVIVETNG